MIKMTKQKLITEIKYQCEKCNTEFFSEETARRCEKRHTCKHADVIYEFEEVDDDDWRFGTDGIKCVCSQCNQELGTVDFEDIEENQGILKSIFNMIKERK